MLALKGAYGYAKEHDIKTVLFAPASKSSDSFESYEQRGKYFDSCFNALRLEV